MFKMCVGAARCRATKSQPLPRYRASYAERIIELGVDIELIAPVARHDSSFFKSRAARIRFPLPQPIHATAMACFSDW